MSAPPQPITLPLWPSPMPNPGATVQPESDSTTSNDALVAGRRVLRLSNVSRPSLTLFRPAETTADKRPLPVVVVFPGGGYSVLAYDLEGTEVCHWLNEEGLACVLVKYRVPHSGPRLSPFVALDDAERAIRLVKYHAVEWNLDGQRVGVLGFSAGGHLAAAVAAQWPTRSYPHVDSADALSAEPAFEMLIYPAYLSNQEKSTEVDPLVAPLAQGPPAFLVQAEDDEVHVENSLAYYLALKQNHIPAEMHLYASGGHGYGLRPTKDPVTAWPVEARRWLHTIGILP